MRPDIYKSNSAIIQKMNKYYKISIFYGKISNFFDFLKRFFSNDTFMYH